MKKNKYYKRLLYHGVSNYSNYKGIENFSKDSKICIFEV